VAIDEHEVTRERKTTLGQGLLKGLGVTLKHLFKHNTVIQYPDEKRDLPPRTRGVIALKEENCTVCMLCARECPDWCIYIDSHKETLPPKREGGRPRKRNVLDRFAIDYALCMYCGICVEVCPYDALFWSPEFEYSEYDIRQLTHEKERLSDWMATVLPPPPLEDGADLPGAPATAAGAAGPGSAQRPSPPAQATAAEVRPEQAPRAPEPAAAPAPPEAAATQSQIQAGETKPVEELVVAEATEQRAAVEQPAAAAAEAVGVSGMQPEGLRSEGEKAPVDPDAVYRLVLDEQLSKGSSPQVAEARAKVARVKAERGLRPTTPTPVAVAHPVPSAPTRGQPDEPVPSGAPRAQEPAPDAGPVAPTPVEERGQVEELRAPPEDGDGGAGTARATEDPDGGAVAAGATEDPDDVYERVLAEERAKGSSDAVAIGRAKAARVRATKGTAGPRGR
jgi:NADH-quinone oxidoreductase subunit I